MGLLLVLLATPVFAIDGTIGVDLVPGAPKFANQFSTTVTDTDSDIDKALDLSRGQSVKSLVRLNGTQNVIGVSFDFTFDNTRLTVTEIRETRCDVDFSSDQSLNELNKLAVFFAQNSVFPNTPAIGKFEYTYDDGTGVITTKPGILLDYQTEDGQFGLGELNTYAREFAANAGGTDVPFWTEVQAKKAAFGQLPAPQPTGRLESVEVSDTLANINSTGVANDNTIVLLARPDRVQNGQRPGLGFDGDAILLEVIFRVKNDAPAGAANITITEAVGITETFQNINTDVSAVATIDTPSVITVLP